MKNYLRLLWQFSKPATFSLAFLVVLGLGLAIAHLTAPRDTAAQLTRAQQQAAKQAIDAHLTKMRRDTLAAARLDTLAAQEHRLAVWYQKTADSLTRLTHPAHATPTRPTSAAEQRAADKLVTDY